ncbi:uncharacterized mitochondrial protein-like protein [Tanacetum coccineum]
MTHLSPKRNMIPKAVLMRSGLVSLTTARPVNTAQPRSTVNSVKAVVMLARPKAVVNDVKGNQVNAVKASAYWVLKPKTKGNPQIGLQDQGVIDNGCSRHKIGNIYYLTYFEEIDGGYVAFGGNPKRGKITGRVPRKNNMYSVDLKNIVPKGGLTCLFAKATSNESKLWHRRLGHINFKTMNKLVKGNLVRDIRSDIEELSSRIGVNQFCERKRPKYDGKAIDEGFFVGSRPNWLFDIDALTKSMNYKPVVVGNQSNGSAGTKACNDAGKARMETLPGKDYILLLVWTADPLLSQTPNSSPDAGFKLQTICKEVTDEQERKMIQICLNWIDDDEDVGAEADMNNLNTFMPVSPIPTTRIHKDHPVEQIIGDLNSATSNKSNVKDFGNEPWFCLVRFQQRTTIKTFKNCLFACFLSQEEPKKVIYALKDPSWIEAMQDVLLQFKLQKVWTLVDLLNRKRAIGTKWVYKNKKDERGIVINNKASVPVGCQEFTSRKALLRTAQSSKSLTASTPMKTQKPLLKDEDGEEVDVYLYRSMIGSLIYLTSSRPDIMFTVCACARYQVNPKVSHLHVVKRIFRYLKGQPKLGLWYPKDSPFDLVAYIDSGYARASLDRKSTIGGCQFLGCRLISWKYKKPTVVANSTTEAEYVAASRCCGQNGIGVNASDSKLMLLMLLGKVNAARHNLLLLVATVKVKTVNGEQQLQALVDGKKIVVTEASVRRDLQLDDKEGTDCLPNATIFEQLTLIGAKTTAWNVFSSTMASAIICLATNQKFNFSKYIFESMVKNLDNAGKFLMYPRFIQVFLDNQLEGMSSHKRIYVTPSHTKKIFANMRRQGKDFSGRETPLFPTMVVQAQEEMGEGGLRRRTLRVLDLENTKTVQDQEITSLKLRVKKLEKKGGSRTHKLRRLYKVGRSIRVVSSDEASLGDQEDASKQGRKIYDIDANEDITLENVHDAKMFYVNDLHGDEVFVEKEVPVKEVSDVGKVNTASIATIVSAAIITEDEITLAQALVELKSIKPKVTTTTTATTKGILFQEPTEEQEVLTIDVMATLFSKNFGGKKKALCSKKVKRIREIVPPTCLKNEYYCLLYLKNMAGWKPKDLKSKSFANIQELFDKAFKRVNTFVDFRTELVEGTKMEESSKKAEVMEESSKKVEIAQERSSKRVGDDLEQENAKKQKVDDDQEAAKMKELMKIVPDEEEVVVDAIPLATKPSSIVDWKIMLRSFDKEDLETLWKLVKAKHGYTRPEEGYKRVLWGDLKTMFEYHVKDAVWRNLWENKVLVWKLFDSCRVHFVRFQNLHVFMLVEKRYPLTPATIIDMLNKKLQADH